jgi:aspartate/tyrosine/aromatic aminotransferase
VKWPWKRQAMRKTSAEQLAAAEREVEVSRQRLHETRENVVKPLQAAAAQNNFAVIIARSLAHGHRKGGGAG